MSPKTAEDYSILLVDDDPTVITVLGQVLQEYGRVRFACTGPDALRMLQQFPIDLVMLDIELPGMNGFEVCSAMKASPLLAEIPVIFITGHDDVEHEVKGLQLGAADFVAKPPRPAQVSARVAMQLRLHEMNKALRKAAATDPLTGIANRRHFDDALHREWLRSQRTGAPLSLLMIDVDYFKAFNDHYGHLEGDQCLRQVARALSRVVHRPADLLARYGGEEFAILLPDTLGRGGCSVARYALQEVRSAQLQHAASPVSGQVSISAGVSAFEVLDHDGGSRRDPLLETRAAVTELVDAADQALYAAKAGGRNHARFLSMADRSKPERAFDLRAQDSHPPSASRAPSAESQR
ncbi:MAG TPA: diguanylate cyclase [Polyangiales bacterium]|nr:diguanylate cyclase [Polyangiales bacterium]